MGSQYATEVSGLTSPLAIRVGFVNSSVATVINETSVGEHSSVEPSERVETGCNENRVVAGHRADHYQSGR